MINLNLKICDKRVILKNGNLSEIYDIKKLIIIMII